jgi:hypothetical protein
MVNSFGFAALTRVLTRESDKPRHNDSRGTGNPAEISLFLSAASLVCVAAWLWLLNPAGETVPARLPVFVPGDERRNLLHLDAANSALLPASRRF